MSTVSHALAVDLYADPVCPWCYIGKRHLDQALAGTEPAARARVRIMWQPFQLNPDLPATGVPRGDYVAAKFAGRAEEVHRRVAAAGRNAGLDLHFDRIIRQPNTRNAHRLLLAAQALGHQVPQALLESLYRAFFKQGEDIGDRAVLTRLAVSAGFTVQQAQALLASDDFGAEVDASQQTALALGVHGVPLFVIGGLHRIEGAQPPAVLHAALVDALGRTPAP